nr:hypothetical protein [Tanacetum cinerariifolium]
VRRVRDDRGRPCCRGGGRGGPRPVSRQSRDHAGHQPAQLRPHRRSRHPRRDPRDDRAEPAAGAQPDRRLFHHHRGGGPGLGLRRSGRDAARRDRVGAVRGAVDD